MSDKLSSQASTSQGGSSADALPATSSSSPWARPPRVELPSPPPEDDRYHPLLEESTPNYSSTTLQRAIITWSHIDNSKNTFRGVLNYYHRLEELEETMSPEARAASRRCEQDLLTKAPPTSKFFEEHFGHIYRRSSEGPAGAGSGSASTGSAEERSASAGLTGAHGASARPPKSRTHHVTMK